MSTDDKVRAAAQNAIKVWSTTYNALVSHHEFECHELDQAMMDLSTALAAALEPPKVPEGAVPEGAVVFPTGLNPNGKECYTVIFPDKKTYFWCGNTLMNGPYFGSSTPDEYERQWKSTRRLTPAEAAAFFAQRGTPEGAVRKPLRTFEPHCDKCGKSIVGTIVCRGYHFLCLDCSETPGAWNARVGK